MSTDLVTAAGRAAGRAAGALVGLDVSDPLREIAAALPGSRSAAAAGSDPVISTALAALGERVRRQSDALTASARAYLDAEAAGVPAGPA